MTRSISQDYTAAVAIISMAGRFPGAQSVEQFWKNIAGGERSIRFFTDEEVLAAGADPAQVRQPGYVKAGTIIEQADLFDATFFGYSAREAEVMDPQHRLFLEVAWEALERAAYDPQIYRGAIGIFAGSGFSTYLANNLVTNPQVVETMGDLQLAVGNERDSLASTVSYKLNMRGPSVAVQTFCSTSLVAVHLACQSLLTYECNLALAGGVAIAIPQGTGYMYQEGGIVSPDGHCRTFDANGQGSVMGNGLGIVVLKRMEEALADGDQIYAVIRGSAVNNDGIRKVGYTAPGLMGQSSVIAIAQSRAGVSPEAVSYIEAHGTATALGDSVELSALLKAFQRGTKKRQFCALGSVKPNVGHLDRAAGVTGLIKTTLALHHKQLPPSIDFESPNPEIELESSPFYVNTRLRDWPANGAPRQAGVNSFGLGGTNAHVVLEEAPGRGASGPARPYHLLVLSARSETALEAATTNLVTHCRANPDLNLADLAYTLQVGRAAFNYRRVLVGRSLDEAIAALDARDPQSVSTKHQNYRDRPLVFLFPDAGGAQAGMAAGLYQNEEVFRAAVDSCSAILTAHLGQDLRGTLYPGEQRTKNREQTAQNREPRTENPPEGTRPTTDDWNGLTRSPAHPLTRSSLDQIEVAHAATFVIAYALARLLMSWGVQPQALLGHGVGELVAACLAGVLSLEDALALVVRRAKCSGPDAELANFIATIRLNAPQLPYVSSVTGTWITPEQATDPGYWSRQPWPADRCADGIDSVWQEASRVLLEVGPGQQLTDLVRRHPAAERIRDAVFLPALPTGDTSQPDQARLLDTLGKLWLAGVQVNWPELYANQRRFRLLLPTYPFERQRYWIEAQKGARLGRADAEDTGKQADIAGWFYVPIWKPSFPPARVDPAALAQRSPWLVFGDDSPLCTLLFEQLAAHNCAVVRVRSGAGFAKLSDTEYTINPGRKDDYRHLLRSIQQPPKTIVHLWSCAAAPETQLTHETFDTAQQHGFYSLLYLAKAISSQLIVPDLALWVISQNVNRVTGGEDLAAEHATLLSACMVIAQENLDLACRSIDIDRPAPGSWQARKLIEYLLSEFAAPSSDLAIAYRHNERWSKTYESRRLEAPAEQANLRPQGVYLIAGGLGGIGMVLAEHLSRTVRARLVLTTRSQFPPAAEWEAWLASHAESDVTSQRIRAFQALQALGAEVLVVNADVADEAQMCAAIQQTRARFGQLHGIIYTAGISDDAGFAPIQSIDRHGCELHFKPKVHGLLTLERVLEDQELDFCVLYSSLASILGGLGFMGYTAANSFIDAFTQRHNQQSPTRWVSVNWDTWGIRENPHGAIGATVMDFAMTREEAVQAFERVVAAAPLTTQVINSTGNLEARINQWVRMEALRATPDTPATLHPRPDLMTPYAPPETDTEQIIAEIWQSVLGVEVGIHDNFLELGGNSLLGTQIATRLRRAFQTDIPLTTLFDSLTVAEMAIAVETILIEELEQLDDEEVVRLVQSET